MVSTTCINLYHQSVILLHSNTGSIFNICWMFIINLAVLIMCLASSENAGNNTPVEELRKTAEPAAGRKRESTDSDSDGPSRKKTASGIQL